MRARTIANSVDIVRSDYWLVDEGFSPVGSGSSFFAFDTVDFHWLDVAFERSYSAESAVQAVATRSGFVLVPDIAAAPDDAISFAMVQPERTISGQSAALDSRFAASATEPGYGLDDGAPTRDMTILSQFAASAIASAVSNTAVGLISGPINFPEGATVEAGFTLLDLVNLAPFASLNQGDTVYMIDNIDSFSLARFETSSNTLLDVGRDPFELTTYLVGDTDNDGIDDYVIRIDKGGPTLMGYDFMI